MANIMTSCTNGVSFGVKYELTADDLIAEFEVDLNDGKVLGYELAIISTVGGAVEVPVAQEGALVTFDLTGAVEGDELVIIAQRASEVVVVA